MLVEVLPLNDSKAHSRHAACLCQPTINKLDSEGCMIIHHAWDAREFCEKEETDSEDIYTLDACGTKKERKWMTIATEVRSIGIPDQKFICRKSC